MKLCGRGSPHEGGADSSLHTEGLVLLSQSPHVSHDGTAQGHLDTLHPIDRLACVVLLHAVLFCCLAPCCVLSYSMPCVALLPCSMPCVVAFLPAVCYLAPCPVLSCCLAPCCVLSCSMPCCLVVLLHALCCLFVLLHALCCLAPCCPLAAGYGNIHCWPPNVGPPRLLAVLAPKVGGQSLSRNPSATGPHCQCACSVADSSQSLDSIQSVDAKC